MDGHGKPVVACLEVSGNEIKKQQLYEVHKIQLEAYNFNVIEHFQL